jgi:5-methylcytosine-specific restriction endonuclease McrA
MKAYSRNQILILFSKNNGKCFYCGVCLVEEAEAKRTPQVDHIVPKSKNGSNKIDNLCLVCRYCNSAKNNKTKEEFLDYLRPYLEGKVDRKDLVVFNKLPQDMKTIILNNKK